MTESLIKRSALLEIEQGVRELGVRPIGYSSGVLRFELMDNTISGKEEVSKVADRVFVFLAFARSQSKSVASLIENLRAIRIT